MPILICLRWDTAPMPRRHPRRLVRQFKRLLPRPGKQTHQVDGVLCSVLQFFCPLFLVFSRTITQAWSTQYGFLLFLSTDVTTVKQCFGEWRLDAAQTRCTYHYNTPRPTLTSRVQVKIDISERNPRTISTDRHTCRGQTPRKGERNICR